MRQMSSSSKRIAQAQTHKHICPIALPEPQNGW